MFELLYSIWQAEQRDMTQNLCIGLQYIIVQPKTVKLTIHINIDKGLWFEMVRFQTLIGFGLERWIIINNGNNSNDI